MPNPELSKPKRGPRRSSAEIRELLISTGSAILLQEGLGSGFSELTFKRVLDRLRDEKGIHLTHASFIGRIFENQSEFQEEVHALLIEGINQTEFAGVIDAALPILEQVDLSSLDSRVAVMDEVSRVGSIAQEKAIRGASSWSIWLHAVAFETTPRHDDSTRFRDKLREILKAETAEFAALYDEILTFLGMRTKDPFTIEDLTVAIAALAEGAAIRGFIEPEIFKMVTLPSLLDDGTSEWTSLGLGIRALTSYMVEPIPGWTPPETPESDD